MPSSSLSSVTSVTFKATSGVPPNVITHGTQTINLAGLTLGPNSVEITHPGIKSALSSGNTINHSLQILHGGFSVVETAGAPYPPPNYSVTNFARVGEFEYSQFGNPNYYPVPKYLTYIQFKSSSVGGVYAHKVAYYHTSNPANKIVLPLSYPATGQITQAAVFPLEEVTDYTVDITLVNKNTGEELTNLQPVQTITFTTPTPPPQPTTENIISVKRGTSLYNGSPTIEVRFSTANGRIPDTINNLLKINFTTIYFLTMVSYPVLLVADADNTSSRSFFTATVVDIFPLPNFLSKVELYGGDTLYSTILNVTLS